MTIDGVPFLISPFSSLKLLAKTHSRALGHMPVSAWIPEVHAARHLTSLVWELFGAALMRSFVGPIQLSVAPGTGEQPDISVELLARTRNPQPSKSNPQPSTQHQPSTLNPQNPTLNHQPLKSNTRPSTQPLENMGRHG